MRPTTRGAVPKTSLGAFLRRVWSDRRVPSHVWGYAWSRARRSLSRIPGLAWVAVDRGDRGSRAVASLINTADLGPLRGRTPLGLAQESFDQVTALLRSGDIPYFVTDSPDHRRSVGVFEENRGAAIEVLRSSAQPGFFLSGLDSESLPHPMRRADQRLAAWFGAIAGSGLTFGPEFGATVEFWALESGGFRRVRGGRPGLSKLFADEPEASIEVDGARHPTLASFKDEILRLMVPFPIDLVITWVDGSDPQWRSDYEREVAEVPGLHPLASDAARYRSWDLLRYSLRSISWYTDFVRQIYLVTAGHVPSWLNVEHPGITTVRHDEIMDTDALPTFNSHSIESRLHHIPGLADYYVYSNDDLLIAGPLAARSLFTREGLAQVTLGSEPIPGGVATEIDAPIDAASKNGRALLEKAFGYVASRKLAHVPFPQIRSLVEELEDRFPDEFDRTHRSRFRHRDDISVAAFLSQHAALATKAGTESEIRAEYVNVADRWAGEKLDQLLERRDLDVLCVNETSIDEDSEGAIASMLEGFLGWILPEPSPFELDR